jgi:hypothetical protein
MWARMPNAVSNSLHCMIALADIYEEVIFQQPVLRTDEA